MSTRAAVAAVLALLLLSGCLPSEQKAGPTVQHQTAAATGSATAQARGTAPAVATAGPAVSRVPTSSSIGGRIAFYSTQEPKGVRIEDAEGRGTTDRLTPIWSADPAWSPDGQRIAFTSGNNSEGYNIFVVDADGTDMRQLTEHGGVWDHPVWSPDGTRIAFHAQCYDVSFADHRIGIVGADGSGLITVKPYWDGGKGECCPLCTPAWSPDGERIAFGGYCRDHDEPGGEYPAEHNGIFLMSLDGSNVTQLIQISGGGSDMDLAWSPDGKRIAFSAVMTEMGGQQIYVMEADGTDLEQLTTDGGYYPCWSPDGRYIAFTSGHVASPQLYVISTDGSGVRRHIGAGSDPDWSR
jgi:TolB protein